MACSSHQEEAVVQLRRLFFPSARPLRVLFAIRIAIIGALLLALSGCQRQPAPPQSSAPSNYSVDETDKGWEYYIKTGCTVSELKAKHGKLIQTVCLKAASGEFQLQPSCHCINVISPELADAESNLKLESSEVSIELELPLVPRAALHSIRLVPLQSESSQHNLIWNFNIVEDISVTPRILQIQPGKKHEIEVTVRNSSSAIVENAIPWIESPAIESFKATRFGNIINEVGNCLSQKWHCQFYVPDQSDPNSIPNSVKILLKTAKNQSLPQSANLILKKGRADIQHPKRVNFGNVAIQKTTTKRIRLGNPAASLEFQIRKISSELHELNVIWNPKNASNNHWITLELTPTNLGNYNSEISVELANGKIYRIEVFAIAK